MKAVKVPLKSLNDTRKALMEKKLMNLDYKIKTKDNYGFIPINEEEKIPEEYEIVDIDLETLKRYPKNFTELLKDVLTIEEIEELKTSFDIIGDIVIVEILEELKSKKKEIGKATLEFTKRKSVFMKKSAIHGTIRIRDLELIAGEDNAVTIHKEHGTRLKLNVKEVYFSPRLATERKRIADNVENGEKILDMFCGIGPFPIVIAKNKNVNITAVDINSDAIKYLNENIKLNKLKGKIRPLCGDIREVAKENFENEKFDRIIMNLPGLAFEFLDLAVDLIADEILNTRKVKSSSPGMWHVSIDGKIIDSN